MDTPTELTKDDIDAFVEKMMTDEIQLHECTGWSNKFLQNYDYYLCDECYFEQFPKEEVKKFYQSIIKDMIGEWVD